MVEFDVESDVKLSLLEQAGDAGAESNSAEG